MNSCAFCAWKSMLRHMGCVEITPYNKDQSEFEFWTRSVNSEKDREMLQILHDLDFLHPAPRKFCDQTGTLWNCIHESLNANKRGQDGKSRILSIVAEQFPYCEIKKNLNISSSDTINEARKYARIHGPGAKCVEKPIFTRTTISHEKLDQLQQFLDDKNNVIMSSYKTETKTRLPVKYLKYTKESLWEKFSYQFPDGVKRTSFMMFLQGKQYIYQENLDGLCSICSRYGYEIFVEMKNFIEKNIQNNNLQKDYINKLEHLRRYLKKSYEQELEIAVNGTVAHNACISHCLPYAFGTYTESHSHECVKCGQLFAIFYQLKNDTPITLHNELEEYQEHLLYYLAHQTRKVYLNTQFNANLLELDEKGALIVMDYKMKVLPKSARETKEQFFGKKGWTLHSVLVYTRKEDSFELDIQAHDHWSNDPRQDAWFAA
ncbi:uncharacterized protein OCT59_002047 [Rhizophagus irregularis]|uniref:uncharacterized protein n=1 Tax=Rhizophagus irregularis TaxID=588596 RepID=UPI003319ECD8|nr:hypothetical protein OCT59_002047 [Rhizophagus irregularis]